jgi:hypothetical protein
MAAGGGRRGGGAGGGYLGFPPVATRGREEETGRASKSSFGSHDFISFGTNLQHILLNLNTNSKFHVWLPHGFIDVVIVVVVNVL